MAHPPFSTKRQNPTYRIMAIYLLERAFTPGSGTHAGLSRMLVSAEDAADALLLAKGYSGSDSRNHWNVTDTTVTAIAAPADWEGIVVEIDVVSPAGVIVESVSVTAAASDVVDDIGGDLATALNATASIANAAYNTSTNVLTVAGAADGLGDHQVYVRCKPASGNGGDRLEGIASFVSSTTDGGSAGDALSVTLDGAVVVPKVFAAF